MNQTATTTVYVNNEAALSALGELKKKLEEVNTARQEAIEKGDFAALKNLDKDAKALGAETEKLKKRFFDVNAVMKDLSGASLSDLNKALGKANTELNKMRKDDPAWKDKAKQVKELREEIDKTSAATRKNSEDTSFWGKTMGGVKDLLPTLGVAALIGGLVSLGKQVFAVREEFQKYEAILKNTLGSEEAGRQALSMLTDAAAELPISLKEATESYIKLANRGITPTKAEMMKLTDVAMSQGKSLDQFVEATLDAMTGEYERLKEFGIRASKDGDKVTFMFKNQKTVVKNNEEAIKEYLLSLGNLPGVAGSSAAVMETLEGKVSNLGDSWDRMLNNMGKNSQGVFSTVIGWLGQLVDIWAGAFKSMDQIKNEVMDKQNASNFEGAMGEIKAMTDKYVQSGMDQKAAEAKAAELYRSSIQISLDASKEDLKLAKGANKEKIQDRITSMEKELTAVDTHYKKLKEIELKKLELSDDEKKKQQKILEDQKKFLDETLILGLSATEKENNEYNEKLKKLGLFWTTKQNKTRDELLAEGKITSNQNKALEIREKEHTDNLTKISEELKNKKKSDEDKFNKEILQINKDSNSQVLQELENLYLSELDAAGNNANARKTIDEKYARDKMAIELGQMESTKQLMLALGESTVEVEQQIADKKKQIKEAEFQQSQERDAARKEYNLTSMGEDEDAELAALTAKYEKELLTDEEYAQASMNIKLKYASQYIQKGAELTATLGNIVSGMQETEITKNTTKYQKDLADLESQHDKKLISDDVYNKKKTTLEKKQQEDEKNIKKKYADKAFAIQVAQIVASTAMAAINAFQSLAIIPIVGPALGAVAAAAAIAFGFVQVGQAKAQRDQVKGLYSGGYTDRAMSDHEPVDVVHANEFVANATAVRNPTVKPVLDAIDMAQRSGTIRSINLPSVIAAQSVRSGFLQGGFTSQKGGSSLPSFSLNDNSNDILVQLIAANTAILQQLNARLEKGIEAHMNNERFDEERKPWVDLLADVKRT